MGTGARARVPLDFQLFNFSSHFRAAQTFFFIFPTFFIIFYYWEMFRKQFQL